ncbi:MAG: histidine phosphatase family protein [Muribaculaceae bacterium]|nr:histidine phosphatase family protein [Muribaculaceae bacterium]
MKKILSFAWVACIAVASLFAAPADFHPLPPDLDGSMMPIDFSLCDSPVIPDSLSPVFAAYVSRHGARYLSSPAKVEILNSALTDADKISSLSDTGRDFLSLIREVIATNEGKWGELSPIGISEQKTMGAHLASVFPALTGKAKTHSVSSYVPRCVMTMYEFNAELNRCSKGLEAATDEGRQFNPWLRCFSADTAYSYYRKDGDWKHVYNDFVRRYVPIAPARRLFAHTNLDDNALRHLTMEMYQVLKANRVAGLPAPTTQWMSVDEYRLCWKADNLNHYLRNNITPLSSLAGQASSPLALELIRAIDAAVATNCPDTVLEGYFGHAETLLPLFSLLRIPGCFALPLDYDDLDKTWRVQDITPLGANLLILTCKSPSGEIYISLQLNGHNIAPWPDAPQPVKWSELRDYWLHLINSYSRP